MVQPWNEPERDGHAPFPVSRCQATCLPRITISLPFANSEFTFANNLRLNTSSEQGLASAVRSGEAFDHGFTQTPLGFTQTPLAKHASFSGSLVAEVSSLCI